MIQRVVPLVPPQADSLHSPMLPLVIQASTSSFHQRFLTYPRYQQLFLQSVRDVLPIVGYDAMELNTLNGGLKVGGGNVHAVRPPNLRIYKLKYTHIHLSPSLGSRASAKTYTDESTKNMDFHLEQVHGITKDNPRDTGRKSTLSRSTSLANVQSQLLGTSWIRTSSVTNRIEFNSDVFKALLIRWICSSNISFAIVEHYPFRQLLTYLLASVCFIY